MSAEVGGAGIDQAGQSLDQDSCFGQILVSFRAFVQSKFHGGGRHKVRAVGSDDLHRAQTL